MKCLQDERELRSNHHSFVRSNSRKTRRQQDNTNETVRQHNTTQHNTTQRNTTQHNTTQHNTTQHNTTQHNTTQHNTTQHNTTQRNTPQDNTTQLNSTQEQQQHSTTQEKRTTEKKGKGRKGRMASKGTETEHNEREKLLDSAFACPRPSPVYYVVRWILGRVVNIFFREIEVIGRENVPADGPIIFVGNHPNQFVVSRNKKKKKKASWRSDLVV